MAARVILAMEEARVYRIPIITAVNAWVCVNPSSVCVMPRLTRCSTDGCWAAGYVGTNCETDVNECASNPCQWLQPCTDGINSFSCNCSPGLLGTLCETNVDECASQPCRNGGTC